MDKGVSGVDIAGSVAVIAIASLGGGPPAAAATGFTEVVKHAQKMVNAHHDTKTASSTVETTVRKWANTENVTEVGPGLGLAARILAAHGATDTERAQHNYNPTTLTTLVWDRATTAGAPYSGQLTKQSDDPMVTIVRRAITTTYGALNTALGTTEPLYPALVELLTTTHHTARTVNTIHTTQTEHTTTLEEIRRNTQKLKSAWKGPQAPTGPLRVGAIPALPAGYIPRDELTPLEEALNAPGVGVLHAAVTGLGGIGKTHIAAAYTRARIHQGWELIIWANAETPTTLLATLNEAAHTLGVHDPDGDTPKSATRLRNHLQSRPTPSLIVFDNATNPDHIRDYTPTTGQARVIITTTNTAFTHHGTTIPVDTYTPTQATHYLTTETTNPDTKGAALVAEELGHLPVALTQAVTVINGPPTLTYQAFLAELATFPLHETLTNTQGQDYPRPVAATLLLAINITEHPPTTTTGPANEFDQEVDRLTNLILRTTAVLSATGTPQHLYTNLLENPTNPTQQKQLRTALHRTTTHHLLTLIDAGSGPSEGGSPVWVMHRLIARVLRDRDTTNNALTHTLTLAYELLKPHFYEPTEPPPTPGFSIDDITTHTHTLWEHTTLLKHTPHATERTREETRLINRLLTARLNWVEHLGYTGALSSAIKETKETQIDAHQFLGPDHPTALAARHHAAQWMGRTGDAGSAREMLTELLEKQVSVLGSKDPYTLTTRSSIAFWTGHAGDANSARQQFEELLPDQVEVLGSNHLHTFITRSNIAYWNGESGYASVARDLYARLLDDEIKVLGADHPHPLVIRHNIAIWVGKCGDATAARILLTALLRDQVRVMGPNHAHTLATRDKLNHWTRLAHARSRTSIT